MEIKLKHMELENFMCYDKKEFDFYENTKIMGSNGIGKSSIATAYMWCLFGCDYELKDNPEVRRIVSGKTIDDVDVSVELLLDVDGTEISVKKVQKRKYNKDKSGYKDDNSYFINDVPKTLKDFNAYLDVDMKILKMCSNINAFLNQKPAEMREYLFGLVDDILDIDIAKKSDKLETIIPYLEKYTVEEISAMNKAAKAKITKEIPILDGQIKEKERDIQLKQDIEVSDLELQRNSLKEQIADCIAKQTDNDKLMAEYEKASSDILNLKFELNDMVRAANEENIQKKNVFRDKIADSEFEINRLNREIGILNFKIKETNENINNHNVVLEKVRKDWKKVSDMKFDDNVGYCQMCGRKLEQEKIDSMISEFETRKRNALDATTKKGNNLVAELNNEKETLAGLYDKVNGLEESVAKKSKEAKDYKKQLSELPENIDITGTEKYKALEQQIAEKEQAMHKANDISAAKAELKEQETALRQQLAECENQIAKSDTAVDEERLSELRQARIDAEQKKADAEKTEYLLGVLERVKNDTLSASINSMFGLVNWELYALNKSGGYKSVCIPTVDGKSILSTMSNKGNRILGRVNICNSIQKINGISAPVILDDSESLDEQNRKKVAEMVDSQLIMLIVNDSEKLEIVEG